MIFKSLICSTLLASSIVVSAQGFEFPPEDEEFSNQTGMNDIRWPRPPSIPPIPSLPSIPMPNKTIEVCGTTFGVSIAVAAFCSSVMGSAVATCAVSGPLCVTAVSYASGICGISVVALGDAVRRCYNRVDL